MPVASLAHAVELAKVVGLRVYACADTWNEPVLLPTEISLFGGFDCADWKYKGAAFRASIVTGPDQIPITVTGFGGQPVIADFEIRAANATIPGGSSIGVFITDTTRPTIRRCVIVPGNGANGLDGDALMDPAASGASGKSGAHLASVPSLSTWPLWSGSVPSRC